MKHRYQRAKKACYLGSVTMAVVSSLSPLLFVTFREMYGISYGLLGLLAVCCFGIQLVVDLVFSFFSSRFNIHKTVCATPLFAFFGILIYAVLPPLFPKLAYLWIVLGTLVFSVSAGLCEVLLSPVVAAIPAENPEKEMSKLHSAYAFGVVGVVIVSTLLLRLLGNERWYLMAALWSALPLLTAILFFTAELPPVSESGGKRKGGIPRGMLLLVLCIFMGGAAEVTMTQWCSGFLEKALNIPKTVGDILGLALFGLLLGVGRMLYARRGKNIYRTLRIGMAGALACYLVSALSPWPFLSLLACVLTGFFTAMLWPGILILMEEKYPDAGVAAFALMAAGGDAGASLGPQMVGLIADGMMASEGATALAAALSMSAEQLGMKTGILLAALFPLCGLLVLLLMGRIFIRHGRKSTPLSLD